MSGYCPDCGNTQCICKEVEAQENAPSSCTVDSPCSVSERVLSIVFAFDDEGRKEAVRNLARRIYDMEKFLRSCRDCWDCDTGANGAHPHYCRKCEAERLLKQNAPREARRGSDVALHGDVGKGDL